VDTYSQGSWTEAQWTRVQETVRDEARKQRVAASFLPVSGPLPEDAQTVPLQTFAPLPGVVPPGTPQQVIDFTTRRLTTISVHVALSSAQVAQEDLSTALLSFRRAANLIARAEDWLVFNGQPAADVGGLPAALEPCTVTGGETFNGLLTEGLAQPVALGFAPPTGPGLVTAVTQATGILETQGHLGPFALVLNTLLFTVAHDPTPPSLVLPADRIKPLLDGPLPRSSTLNNGPIHQGVMVALGADLVDLVVAREIGVCFIQVTAAAPPQHLFRVSERFTLRIKQPTAIVALAP
jgi:uncharacterized linocin/CFP29 family protein